MLLAFDDRPSDSPFVERVWRCHSERAGRFLSVASPHWEMVVTRHRGRTTLTLRGPETRPTDAHCPAEGEWVAVRFKLGTFRPGLPVARLLDRNDLDLPEAVENRSFWLEAHLTRSLRRWIGQTPAKILRATKQLSFLYNTAPPRWP
jgi:hypothetical protein